MGLGGGEGWRGGASVELEQRGKESLLHHLFALHCTRHWTLWTELVVVVVANKNGRGRRERKREDDVGGQRRMSPPSTDVET